MKDIEQLTIAEAKKLLPQARELIKMFGEDIPETSPAHVLPAPVGSEVYIRTAVYHAVGRISGLRGKWLGLEEASYVASDGRFSVATSRGLQNTENAEIEVVGGSGRMLINMDMICDVTTHHGGLPKDTQ